MKSVINIKNLDELALASYVTRQVNNLIPDDVDCNLAASIQKCLPHALDRLKVCINSIKIWRLNEFDYLHSSQYCTFLYYLANTIWSETGDSFVASKLFLLNKALNGIDLFYEIEMPNRFFIGHSIGIVLAKAVYSDYLVLYQNSTVGKNHGIAPVIDSGVIMYPNTAIIGRSHVRSGTVVSQGASIINKDTPGNCLVFQKEGYQLEFKINKRDILKDIFRDPLL